MIDPSPRVAAMEDKTKEPKHFLLIVTIVGVVVLWGALGYFASTRADPGRFGDMFGAVNALFSGLAFAGLIYAIWLQRVELRLQREELAATRAELRGQKEQLVAQNNTLKKQSFENTFFQLLKLHNDIVNAIDLVKTGEGARTTKGRDCFSIFYGRLKEAYETDKRTRKDSTTATRHVLNEVYMRFYVEHEAELGHYFRSLYNTVKLVRESDVLDKRLYTNLVRAQLSSYELLLLFYDSLSEMGREKFKPLIVEYELLKHLQTKELLDPNHASLY